MSTSTHKPTYDELAARVAELEHALELATFELDEIRGTHDTLDARLAELLSLTRNEAAFLALLYRRSPSVVHVESAFTVLYSHNPASWPGYKIFDVMAHRVRLALRPHNITIDTVWGRGKRLLSSEREKLAALLAAPPRPKTLAERSRDRRYILYAKERHAS